MRWDKLKDTVWHRSDGAEVRYDLGGMAQYVPQFHRNTAQPKRAFTAKIKGEYLRGPSECGPGAIRRFLTAEDAMREVDKIFPGD